MSRTKRAYVVSVFGVIAKVSAYELDYVSDAIDRVPGLIGPDELSMWPGRIDFTNKSVEAFGRQGEIINVAP